MEHSSRTLFQCSSHFRLSQTITLFMWWRRRENSRFMKSRSMSAVFMHLEASSWHFLVQIYSSASPPSLETWIRWVPAGWRPAWVIISRKSLLISILKYFCFSLCPLGSVSSMACLLHDHSPTLQTPANFYNTYFPQVNRLQSTSM